MSSSTDFFTLRKLKERAPEEARQRPKHLRRACARSGVDAAPIDRPWYGSMLDTRCTRDKRAGIGTSNCPKDLSAPEQPL